MIYPDFVIEFRRRKHRDLQLDLVLQTHRMTLNKAMSVEDTDIRNQLEGEDRIPCQHLPTPGANPKQYQDIRGSCRRSTNIRPGSMLGGTTENITGSQSYRLLEQ